MARFYLDSVGGSNTSPYDTIAKAADKLEDILADGAWVGAGDDIYFDKDHVDATTSTTVWTGGTLANPVPLRRVDFGASNAYAPTTGADTINFKTTVSQTNLTFSNFVVYGAYIETDGHLLTGVAATNIGFIDCKHKNLAKALRGVKMGTANGDGSAPKFKNMTFEGIVAQAVYVDNPCDAVFDLCTWIGEIAETGLVDLPSNDPAHIRFNYCDFSGITTDAPIMVDTSTPTGAFFVIDFVGCKFPSGYSLTDTFFSNEGQFVREWHSDTGNNSYPLREEGFRGVINTSTATYLTDGFVHADQATNLSRQLVPSSVCEAHAPLQSFDITQWHDSTGSVTVTIECWDAFTTALQDDEAWMEVYYLDGTDVTGSLDTTQVVAGTTANLTAGTGAANWTGEPSGRSVKFVSSSLSIGKKGLIVVRIYLGKYESGKSLFINPQMTVA